ncbi:curli assembly protein CsgF [Roseomonas nepalensis]|uniref:Curli production assembly/transport component CsgF n=1 Tax=Muricoccus nepalensis TaxID=1854500 RepID=A0A502FVV8_9PROT|nr:curli assembly protein CsgF [Roseomonas nepalensis]TPG53787.1 curli assembly protein CsgF [Roseomonas nepalensis]
MQRSAASAVAFLLLAFSPPQQVLARDLVYQPVNPAFGGSPLNGSFILGQASANNSRYVESPQAKRQRQAQEASGLNSNDPAAQFQRQITSSLLSQIASTVSQQILGENARDSGQFSVGGTSVVFNRVGGQIVIDINEGSTGGRTQVTLPVPNF